VVSEIASWHLACIRFLEKSRRLLSFVQVSDSMLLNSVALQTGAFFFISSERAHTSALRQQTSEYVSTAIQLFFFIIIPTNHRTTKNKSNERREKNQTDETSNAQKKKKSDQTLALFLAQQAAGTRNPKHTSYARVDDGETNNKKSD
jgi:hypothetical protein